MPLLQPDRPQLSAGTNAAAEILRDAGILGLPTGSAISEKRKKASDILTEVGLGLDGACMELAILARDSGNESIKYKAIQDALKIHGAFEGTEQNNAPQITFVLQQDCNVMQILNPNR